MIRRTRIGRRPSFRWRTIPSKYLFLLTVVLFFALLLQAFFYVEKNLSPTIKDIARMKAEQMANQSIQEAISKDFINSTDFRKLVEFQKDNNGQIESVLFNDNEYARIVGEARGKVIDNLNKLEAVPQKIPLGQVLQSNLLASLGPDIPITLLPMGTVHVELQTRMQQAAINNVLVTAVLVIESKVKIVIPFSSEPAVVKSEVPLSSALIVGNVPQFYYDGNGNPVGSAKPGIQAPTIIPPVQANTSVQKQQ